MILECLILPVFPTLLGMNFRNEPSFITSTSPLQLRQAKSLPPVFPKRLISSLLFSVQDLEMLDHE
jgi:hypothetical protein